MIHYIRSLWHAILKNDYLSDYYYSRYIYPNGQIDREVRHSLQKVRMINGKPLLVAPGEVHKLEFTKWTDIAHSWFCIISADPKQLIDLQPLHPLFSHCRKKSQVAATARFYDALLTEPSYNSRILLYWIDKNRTKLDAHETPSMKVSRLAKSELDVKVHPDFDANSFPDVWLTWCEFLEIAETGTVTKHIELFEGCHTTFMCRSTAYHYMAELQRVHTRLLKMRARED